MPQYLLGLKESMRSDSSSVIHISLSTYSRHRLRSCQLKNASDFYISFRFTNHANISCLSLFSISDDLVCMLNANLLYWFLLYQPICLFVTLYSVFPVSCGFVVIQANLFVQFDTSSHNPVHLYFRQLLSNTFCIKSLLSVINNQIKKKYVVDLMYAHCSNLGSKCSA